MSDPTSGSAPAGYREVLHWTITGQPARMIWLQISSGVLMILLGFGFISLAVGLGKLPTSVSFNGSDLLSALPAGFVGIGLTLVLHELVHGWTMQAFGARPVYGVLWAQLAFYATAPGHAFRRNQFIIVALAPFVSLSLLAVLGIGVLNSGFGVVLLVVCAILNGSGAVGDLWLTVLALRYPATAYIMDERDGIRVFLP